MNKVKNFFQAVMMKPSPAGLSQAIKSLKPHVPLIKFRKGSGGVSHASSTPSTPNMAAATNRFQSAPSTPLKPNQAMQMPTIEDWQLPMRYRRRLLDEEEIAYINRGGPEK